MVSILAKAHLFPHLSLSLLNLLLLAECDKLRLVGPSRCSGTLEVFHRNTWVRFCDDQWGLASAHVVCRELNCGTAVEAKRGSFFGGGSSSHWAYTAQCAGSEASIFDCPRRRIERAKCNQRKEAGVICSDNVRLLKGSTHCNGRVEVFHDGQWKQACGNDWGQAESEVVCQEINCGTAIFNSETQRSGEERELVGVTTSCIGNETSFDQCSVKEVRERCRDATVFCADSKPVRLVNGTNRCSGRVEIQNQRQWGSVCDDGFGMAAADVVCRQMGCGLALAVNNSAYFGRGQDSIWLDDVDCTGSEVALSQCPHRGFGQHNCDHSEDVGVICSEMARLVNGTQRCSGRLEVFFNDQWVQMCNNNWGPAEATTVCRELRCGGPKSSREMPSFGGGTALSGLTGRCAGNASSIAQCDLQEHLGSCEAVSISCSDPILRLVNSTNRCSGRVEVSHNGVWGTVCDAGWDIRDAQVVCRAMDCGTAQLAKHAAAFGKGKGNIWLSQTGCLGNESSLLECQHPPLGENSCSHGNDAGVVCAASIRLENGDNHCSGRVEVLHAGYWSTVYNVGWGMNEATVACREMHCGDAVKISGSFGRSRDQRGYKVSCTGIESSLTKCTLTEYVRSSGDQTGDAAVVCSGNVKLGGGDNRCAGRVEFYDKGQWGTVCGEAWGRTNSEVVCKQLDCGKEWKTSILGGNSVATGHTWVEQITCSGTESTLAECPQMPYEDRTCRNQSIAHVVCLDSLMARLVNGSEECSGRVEVRHGNMWQTVCDAEWTPGKAVAVCEAMHCGTNASALSGAHFGRGGGPVVEASGSCFDSVNSLVDCSRGGFRASSCGHDRDAGVTCASQIRLVSESSKCAGRVEVFFRGQWGTVCDDSWDTPDAEVVCRQLGCGNVSAVLQRAHFGGGTGLIWLDDVGCTGQESALTLCPHAKFGDNNCLHVEDAGVVCSDALQKPQIEMNPGPEVSWGSSFDITCSITTQYLGGKFLLKNSQESITKEQESDDGVATFTIMDADFVHAGLFFCGYRTKIANQILTFPQGDSVNLSVTVPLEKPSVTLKSSHAMAISPNKMTLSPGSSFSIICSTYSNYGDGVFYLTESKANTTEAMPAFGHTHHYQAVFEFPEIETSHLGLYSCVYGVNVSSLFFHSVASNVIQVVVHVPPSPSVIAGVVSVLVILLVLVVIGYLVWRKRRARWAVGSTAPNRFQGMTRWDAEDRDNRSRDERDQHDQHGQSGSLARADDVSEAESFERSGENLVGRVSYELEPLVMTK